MKKRVLAIMLACLMLVSVLPMGAMAAEYKCPGEGVHNVNNCAYEVVQVVKPECGGKVYGYTLYSCKMCGEVFADGFALSEAKNHEWTIVGGTSCKDGGQRKCALCDKVEEAHEWEDSDYCDEARTCKYCGAQETDKDGNPITGKHVWEKEPTKIVSVPNEQTYESGSALFTCEECGDTELFEILAHDCMDNLNIVGATTAEDCEEAGYKAHAECRICGRWWFSENFFDNWKEVTKADMVTEPAGHKVQEGTEVITVAPSCTSTGLHSYICSECGEEIVDEVMPKAHDYIELEQNEVKVTCTTYGYKIFICANPNCPDGTKIETVKPTGHSKRPDDAVKYEATCTQNAYYEWICTNANCSTNNIAKEEIPNTKLNHELKKVEVASTCAEYAYSFWYCARVDEYGNPCCDGFEYVNYIKTQVNKIGEDGKVVIDPDTKKPVKEDYYIFLDDSYAIMSSQIQVAKGFSKTNHVIPENYTGIAPTCTTDGFAAFVCVACDVYTTVKLPATGHTKGEKVDVPATCQKPGYKGYACEDCDVILEPTPVPFVHKDVYASLDEAVAAHPHALAWQSYTIGDGQYPCENTTYYTAICSEIVNNKAVGCNKTILVKEAAGHVPAGELGARPVVELPLTIPMYDAVKLPDGLDADLYDLVGADDMSAYAVMNRYVFVDGGYVINNFYSWTEEPVNVMLVLKEGALDNLEFAAGAPACEVNGWTAQFECVLCGEWIASETYVAADEEAGIKEQHPELKALEHNKSNVVTAIKATCDTAGRTEGYDCSICKVSIKSEVIPALGHDWRYMGYTDNDDFQCDLMWCATCDIYTVQNYVAYCDHVWVADRDDEGNKAATCTKPGAQIYVCELCNVKNEVETGLADHVNKDGVIINECDKTDAKVDRNCVTCKEEIKYNGIGHVYTTEVVYGATCTEYGYTIQYCEHCDHYEYKINTAEKPIGHDWELTVVTNPKDPTEIIGGVYVCANCGEKMQTSEAVDAVIFSFEITNAADAKAAITDGSLIKVAVKVNGKNVGIWGLRMDIAYSENLKFESCEGASSDFMALANNNAKKDEAPYVSLFAQANGTEDYVVDGEATVAYLYFRVNKAVRHDLKDAEGKVISEEISISVKELNDVRNADGDKLPYSVINKSAKTVEFLDLDGDNMVSVNDVLAAYKLMTSGKNDARVDINKNGQIDVEDMNALYLYFIGAKDYAATVKVGISTKK